MTASKAKAAIQKNPSRWIIHNGQGSRYSTYWLYSAKPSRDAQHKTTHAFHILGVTLFNILFQFLP
jgi:hypothetical protein